MNSCLIMGFGRSGTSLMGNILHHAGYYMGENLYPPRSGNPTGFFECARINGINERILSQYDHYLTHDLSELSLKKFSPYRPGEGHRWLSYVPADMQISTLDTNILNEIQKALDIKCFAYKDPRFNYTLDVWLPFLQRSVVMICMFREPAITIESVMIECQSAEYLADFDITHKQVEKLWINSYIHLLKKAERLHQRKFIFIHYKQLLSGESLVNLSEHLGILLTNWSIKKELNRTRTTFQPGSQTKNIYEQLCQLAHFSQVD